MLQRRIVPPHGMLPVHRLMARQRRPLVQLLLLHRQHTAVEAHLIPPYTLSRTYHIATVTRPKSNRHAPFLLALSPLSSSRPLSSHLPLRRTFATSSSSSSDPKQQRDSGQQQHSQQDEQKQQTEQDQQADDPYADMQDGRTRLRSILRVVGLTVLLGGSFMAGFHLSSRGAKVHSDRTTPRSYVEVFTDIYDGLHDWITNTLGTSDTPLLPPPTLDPFNRKPRTLVVGLEDTLTHHDWDRYTSHQLQQRPYLHELLEGAVRQGWEVVLFSSKPQMEVEADIVTIDKSGLLRHRLFYDQTNMRDWHLIKDLTRLGRERTRVLVVDWDRAMYKGWEDNVYTVRRWKGLNELDDNTAEDDKNADSKDRGAADRELREVLKVLEKIQRYNVYDVRRVLARRNAGEKELFAEEEELAEQARKGLQERQSKQRVRQREDVVAAGAGKSEGGWLSALASLFSRAGTGGKKLVSTVVNEDEQS